jgi:HPt (histidine-containing phosphotransfer) domain-containing protein
MKDELREYFAGRLPARLQEIEEASSAACEAGWGGEPLRRFHRLTHSLVGAGATFGHPAVTEVSRRLERLLRALLEGPVVGDGVSEQVAALLAELGVSKDCKDTQDTKDERP